MSKDVEGIEAAKCTIIALGLYLSGFAVKRPHTNKVISSCYRSFLKKTPELLQQELTWDRAAFGDVYCSCITSPPQAGKAKKRKYMQALLVLSQKNQTDGLLWGLHEPATGHPQLQQQHKDVLQAGYSCGKIHLAEAEISFLHSKGRWRKSSSHL